MTNRQIAFHPIGKAHFQQALATAAAWFAIPEQADGWVKVGALAILGLVILSAILLYGKNKPLGTDKSWMPITPEVVKISAISILTYVCFLFVSISLIDANTPLDQRLLSPVFVLLLILIAFSMSPRSEIGAGRWAARSVMLLVCIFLAGPLQRTYALCRESRDRGLGFNAIHWSQSLLIREIASSRSTRIYSNLPDAVYYLAGKDALKIPAFFSKVTSSLNAHYGQDILKMRTDLDQGGMLVYFHSNGRAGSDEMRRLIQDLHLRLFHDYPDGVIYVH
jgi:hypothetical protein